LLEKMEQLTGVKAPESTLTQDRLRQLGKVEMADERATHEHGLPKEHLEPEQMAGSNREREDEIYNHDETASLPGRTREMDMTRERETVRDVIQDFVMDR
jgi:hypothetical protein